MRRLLAATLGAMLPLAGLVAQQAATPAAADLAAMIQAHYNSVHDFKAGFRQVYTSGALGQKEIDSGDVTVKKPNRMFWKYTVPEKKSIIADGAQMIWYDPAPGDARCTINPLPTGDDISYGILFLAGRGDLTRDFTSTVPAKQDSDTWRLDLVPRKTQDDFIALSIIVLRRTLALQSFITTDAEHNTSRFEFTNLHENIGVNDREFAFTPPRGVKCE
jgi:outer membrane lipoprotein carrier protein